MDKRLVALALFVGFVAWRSRPPPSPSEESEHAPQLSDRIQRFLEYNNLSDTITKVELDAFIGTQRPGLSDEAPKAKRSPVVIVPGITSCGLEIWKAAPCLGEKFFRRRIWGDLSMAEAILANWTCWLEHLALDPVTGLDKEGIRVRSATGVRAADYFVSGYWLWAKMVQNLADVGYDEDDILMECYDWRLAFPILESRDGRFTSMRFNIEKAVARSGHKAVVIGHSMGALVWLYFMQWVEQRHPGWIDRHVATFVNAAGAVLGAMGPLAAYMSGEMEATATLGPLGGYVETLAISWDQARDLYWSFGGLGALLPMGGTAVWGSQATGFTDTPVETMDMGYIGPKTLEEIFAEVDKRNLPLASYAGWTSYDREHRHPEAGDRDDPRRFVNPLATALPMAPNMKIHCLYGTGIPTERAYRYTLRQVRWSFNDYDWVPDKAPMRWSSSKGIEATMKELGEFNTGSNAERPVKIDTIGGSRSFPTIAQALRKIQGFVETLEDPENWMRIDSTYYSNLTEGPWGTKDGVFSHGVSTTDGDGTVPLVSLGYMCSNGWRDFPEYNPAGIRVYTKEFAHQPSTVVADLRGGPATAAHVELIGNSDFIMDILQIVAGDSEYLERDTFISNITAIGPVVTARLRAAMP